MHVAMMRKVFVLHLLLKIVAAQINGEFWWLNNKVRNVDVADVEKPKFEDIKAFENDDGDKIVFRNRHNSVFKVMRHKDFKLHFSDGNTKNEEIKEIHILEKSNNTDTVATDVLTFHYPKNTPEKSNAMNVESNETQTMSSTTEVIDFFNDKISFQPVTSEDIHAEDICSYTDHDSCHQRGGLVYQIQNKDILHDKRLAKAKKQSSTFSSPVCCILPLTNDDKASPRIYFPGDFKNINQLSREKRSNNLNNGRSSSITGVIRKAIQLKIKQAELKPTRIVTSADEYDEDPYDNIRNPIFRPTRRPVNKFPTSPSEYEDYAAELPKPGLTGLYSDCGPAADKNFDYASDDNSDESYDTGYGVATLNPLFDERTPSANTRFPIRHSTSSQKQSSYETGSETITYQAYPDYQALKGFKLLYLVRNRDRNYTKGSRKSTTSSVTDYGSLESVAVDAEERPGLAEYDDASYADSQVFRDCGKAGAGDQSGTFKSSPWLALVLSTRRQKLSMCYATIVHPRAAVTTASCVQGAPDLTLYAGARDLATAQRAQARRPAVLAHAQHSRGDLHHDLAVLHWARALQLSAAVQPACLGAPRPGDDCAFVGWGREIESLSPRPRSQRATVSRGAACARCVDPRRGDLFCADVSAAGCVSSPGAGLVCRARGRYAAVGVLVARAACDAAAPAVLIPVDDWVRRALTDLGIV